MATSQKEWRGLIEYRVNYLNSRTNSKYCVNYVPHYGGWEMYVLTEGGGHGNGKYGFSGRKSSPEMYNYLEGLLLGLGLLS